MMGCLDMTSQQRFRCTSLRTHECAGHYLRADTLYNWLHVECIAYWLSAITMWILLSCNLPSNRSFQSAVTKHITLERLQFEQEIFKNVLELCPWAWTPFYWWLDRINNFTHKLRCIDLAYEPSANTSIAMSGRRKSSLPATQRWPAVLITQWLDGCRFIPHRMDFSEGSYVWGGSCQRRRDRLGQTTSDEDADMARVTSHR